MSQLTHPFLHSEWAYTLHHFSFFETLAQEIPLLALHSLLDGIERRIVDRLRREHGSQALTVWERARHADDAEIEGCAGTELCGNYVRLASVICRLEQREIEALQAEGRAA